MYVLDFTCRLIIFLNIILLPRLTLAQTVSVETIKFDCQSGEQIGKNIQSDTSCLNYSFDLNNSLIIEKTASEYSFTHTPLAINFHSDEYIEKNQFDLQNQSGNKHSVNKIVNQPTQEKNLNRIFARGAVTEVASIQIANWYNIDFHNLEDQDANTIVTRFILPFTTGKLDHVARINMPINTHSPFTNSGISDITIFDLMFFNTPIGRWGIGPLLLIPTGGNSRGYGKWALGPAIIFSRTDGNLTWGMFNQNVFNIGSINGAGDRPDVNASLIQPILNYNLGKGWSVGSSEMLFTYNWDTQKWIALPLGIRVSKIVKLAEQPIQFNLQYEHNFADDQISISNTLRFGVRFIFSQDKK
jgi:hypothetical protein